ncbi:flavin reductase family protein [Vibrio sonorensis]|uniref:flavin reductase family protein n=1 Tax=Vibrio sonorensis TaxID=1004316 RepID=UPI0008DAA129|nr:flavin reductase family protein [Vibrio sonorensis]
MSESNYNQQALLEMDARHRARLINSLSGFKSANLIGTIDKNGRSNLSIVSSVIHFGANPPLLGFVSRPHSVERHTLENIVETGCFTINSVDVDIALQSHQTSARYTKEESEFDKVDLAPYWIDSFPAPFVLESSIKIGLELVEHHLVKANDTVMVIGEVKHLSLPESAVMPDGYVDIESLDLIALSGLDSYHVTQRLQRLSYAKPNQMVFPLTLEGDVSSWPEFSKKRMKDR